MAAEDQTIKIWRNNDVDLFCDQFNELGLPQTIVGATVTFTIQVGPLSVGADIKLTKACTAETNTRSKVSLTPADLAAIPPRPDWYYKWFVVLPGGKQYNSAVGTLILEA